MNLSYLSQDTRLLMSNSEHFISLVPWVPWTRSAHQNVMMDVINTCIIKINLSEVFLSHDHLLFFARYMRLTIIGNGWMRLSSHLWIQNSSTIIQLSMKRVTSLTHQTLGCWAWHDLGSWGSRKARYLMFSVRYFVKERRDLKHKKEVDPSNGATFSKRNLRTNDTGTDK